MYDVPVIDLAEIVWNLQQDRVGPVDKKENGVGERRRHVARTCTMD